MLSEMRKECEMENAIKKQFDICKEIGDEAGKKNAIAAHSDFIDGLRANGDGYARVYGYVSDSVERGNDYIDVSECIFEKDVPAFADLFKKFGVDRFTFSSSWSSAVNVAWVFQQNGYKVVGLIEINSPYTNWETDEREKTPAYLLELV